MKGRRGRQAGIIVVLVFLAGCQGARTLAKPPTRPFFYVVMADPQFGGVYGGKTAVRRGVEDDAAAFAKAVQHINRLKPAFVVILGNLVNKQCEDAREVEEFKRAVAGIDKSIPVYLVPGLRDTLRTAQGLARYCKAFGTKDSYSFDYANTRHIVLNSMLIGETRRGRTDRDQLACLREELRTAHARKASRIFVYLHQPIYWDPVTPKDKEPVGLLVRPRRSTPYTELFERYGVTAVFSAYHHREGYSEVRGVEYIVTGSACVSLGSEPAGFRIVKVGSGGVEQAFYGYGNMPAEIRMDGPLPPSTPAPAPGKP